MKPESALSPRNLIICVLHDYRCNKQDDLHRAELQLTRLRLHPPDPITNKQDIGAWEAYVQCQRECIAAANEAVEWVRGKALADQVRQGPLPTRISR